MINFSNKLKILAFLFIFSCKTLYYERKGFEDYENIKIKKDSTYLFYYFHSFLVPRGRYISGNWQVLKDTLFLKVKIIKSKYKITEKFKQNSDSIYFEIKLKLFNCNGMWYFIYVNNKFERSFDKKFVKYTIKKQKVTNFSIIFFDDCIGEVNYKIKDPNANYFQIQIFDEDSIKNGDTLFKSMDLKRNYFYQPTKFIKRPLKLIPLTNDTPRKEFALKRKFFIRKR